MKVAYTGWTWLLAGPNTPDEQKIRMFEQSMKEISYLGYDCAENFAFISDFIKPEQVKEICARYNLPLVNVYGHFSTDVEMEIGAKMNSTTREIARSINCISAIPRLSIMQMPPIQLKKKS